MYIITHRNRRERKPVQNTELHRTNPAQRHAEINRSLNEQRRNLHRRDGMSKDGRGRLVASIPAEVIREVRRNDGAAAVQDTKYLIRRAEELGHPVRMGRSKRRR